MTGVGVRRPSRSYRKARGSEGHRDLWISEGTGTHIMLLASLQAGYRISGDYVLVHLGDVKEKVVYHLSKEKLIDDTCKSILRQTFFRGEAMAIHVGTIAMGSCSGAERLGSTLHAAWEVGIYIQGAGWGQQMGN